MKTLTGFALAAVLSSLISGASPVGICLHADDPNAPADKIECFEFEKVEPVGADYRFFQSSDRAVMVSAYRFRDIIHYKADLTPGSPKFNQLLKLYEETAQATPSTRPYLNPKVLSMRHQIIQSAKQVVEVAKLPTITLPDGSQLIGCVMTKMGNGVVTIRHQGGIENVSLKDLKAEDKAALSATSNDLSLEDPSISKKDPTGSYAKIVLKNGVVLKNARFKEALGSNLVFRTEGKMVSIPAALFPADPSVLDQGAWHRAFNLCGNSLQAMAKALDPVWPGGMDPVKFNVILFCIVLPLVLGSSLGLNLALLLRWRNRSRP